MSGPNHRRPSLDQIIRAAAVIAVIALGLALAGFKAREYDLPIHLAAGRWIALHQAAPRTDMFNFTREREPWIDALPLFQLLCYSTYRVAGEPGFTALTMGLCILLVLILIRNRPPAMPLGITAFVLLAFTFGTSSRNHLRPELLTAIYMAAMFGVAERARQGPTRALILAPLIQLLWVNTEGLWPIGIAILGAGIADHAVRAWGQGARARAELLPGPHLIALAAAILAGFGQAYGVRGFLFPLLLVRESFSHTLWHKYIIVEFQPLFSDPASPAGYFFFLPLAALAAAATITARRNVRPCLTVLGAVFIFLALDARRNISIASVALAQIMLLHGGDAVRGLTPLFRARLDRAAAVFTIAASAGLIILTQTQSPWRWDQSLREPGFGLQDWVYPRRATAFLKEINYRGNIINNFDIGGWLMWEGFPEWKVMADGRGEIRGNESLALWARVILDHETFRAVADHYQVEAVVITVYIYDLRVFANRLRRDPEWALVLADPESRSEVYLRRTPRWEKVIAEREIR